MDCSKTKEHDYEYPTMNYLEIPNTSVNDIPYIHVYFWLSISGNSSENCIVGMLLTCPINFSCRLPYWIFDLTHRVMRDYDLQVWHCPHQSCEKNTLRIIAHAQTKKTIMDLNLNTCTWRCALLQILIVKILTVIFSSITKVSFI